MSCQGITRVEEEWKMMFVVVVKSQWEPSLAFSLDLMTPVKFEWRSVLVNKKGKQKQRYATCNTLFLKWAEISYEDGIWRFKQNRDVTQHEVPTVFSLFSMQEHTYRWLTVKMPYIRLPKYLVHFRWWKDTAKIVIKAVSSCSFWSIEFLDLVFFFFFFWSDPILHSWTYAPPLCPPQCLKICK